MGFGVVRFAAWAIKHYADRLNSPLWTAGVPQVLEAAGGLRRVWCKFYAAGILGWVSNSGGFIDAASCHGRGISGFCYRGRQFVHIISTLGGGSKDVLTYADTAGGCF